MEPVRPIPPLDPPPFDPGAARSAAGKLRANQPVTRVEAESFLSWLVTGTLDKTRLTIRDRIAPSPVEGQEQSLWRVCGVMSDIAAIALDDLGVRYGSTDSRHLRGWTDSHVALTVPMNVDGQRTVFLVDPSFRQFFYLPEGRSDSASLPGVRLAARLPEGTLNRFLGQGFVAADEAFASAWAASLCGGKETFLNPKASLAYLASPPPDEEGRVPMLRRYRVDTAGMHGWFRGWTAKVVPPGRSGPQPLS